jgi:hypothetical protein
MRIRFDQRQEKNMGLEDTDRRHNIGYSRTQCARVCACVLGTLHNFALLEVHVITMRQKHDTTYADVRYCYGKGLGTNIT